MLFNSYPFAVLLIITFFIYYIPKLSRIQVPILIISSLIFYSHDQLHYVLLLLFSAGINVVTSYYVVYGNVKYKKALALGGVVVNLCGLAFFKYSPLVAKTVLGYYDPNSVGYFLYNIPLPIGISFFTFEGISLLIDVWKEKYAKGTDIVDKSLKRHAQHTLFFISFFPHLIAGPILKAHDFYPQIGRKYMRNVRWEIAFKGLIVGYFLKMVLADNLKDFTHWMNFADSLASPTLLVLMFGYSAQIFADFAGYSLIAIGLARLFGYNIPDNFNFPYIATSFKEFWKRWHISLSTFLMEYLYFPLGGNRKGKYRTYVNLFITMVLGGLWHGAAWRYAIWGGLHGSALAIERLIVDKTKSITLGKFLVFLRAILVFTIVSCGWVLFKLNFQGTFGFFKSIGANVGHTLMPVDIYLLVFVLLYSLPVFVYHAVYLCKGTILWAAFKKVEYVFYGILLFLIVTNSGTSGAFIYFQF